MNDFALGRLQATFLSGLILATLVTAWLAPAHFAAAQEDQLTPAEVTPPPEDEASPADPVREIEVAPTAADNDIAERLTRILAATEWFTAPEIEVDEGIVFLTGTANTAEHREWAGRLANNTEGVVAVVNRLQVPETSPWDLSPAWAELADLGASLVRNSPLLLLGFFLLVLTWLATKWSVRGASRLLHGRLKSSLLRDVAARAVAVPVFLLGLYLVLRVSGLTRLAMTVLGGTGLLGLVIGFAFRDIAENFLASILISMQHPFAGGDLIEVAGYLGYVQSVNTRATLLMTLDGNHVQIPNATIYKETITNFTANPNTRAEFVVGIGYDDSIAQAQSVALGVLKEHPAVVNTPESLVLVDSLGAATVNLRVYFWVDTAQYSIWKVRSAALRLIKAAFDEAGVSMPDEAREVVFPSGVPVRMLSEEQQPAAAEAKKRSVRKADEAAVHFAEDDFTSEAREIEVQARQSRVPEGGEDLLEN